MKLLTRNLAELEANFKLCFTVSALTTFLLFGRHCCKRKYSFLFSTKISMDMITGIWR